MGPALHPSLGTRTRSWGHQQPPNFCLQNSTACISPHTAREALSTEHRRDACSCMPKYPGLSSKRVFWPVWESSSVVVKVVNDFTIFLFSPSFWLQCGGNVATAAFVAVHCYWLMRLFFKWISLYLLILLFALPSPRAWRTLTYHFQVFLCSRWAARVLLSHRKGHK